MISGVEQKAHYLAMDLPHSDDCFVAAFPAETTEAFLESHVRAFVHFGGVPTRIFMFGRPASPSILPLYLLGDNLTTFRRSCRLI